MKIFLVFGQNFLNRCLIKTSVTKFSQKGCLINIVSSIKSLVKMAKYRDNMAKLIQSCPKNAIISLTKFSEKCHIISKKSSSQSKINSIRVRSGDKNSLAGA